MNHQLQITCNKDLSSMIRKDGVESYEYHFLLTTRKIEVDIDAFLKLLDTATKEKWRYKELCQDKFFILISRIASTEEFFTFEVSADFVPLQNKYIVELPF